MVDNTRMAGVSRKHVSMLKLFDGLGSRLNEGLSSTGSGTL